MYNIYYVQLAIIIDKIHKQKCTLGGISVDAGIELPIADVFLEIYEEKELIITNKLPNYSYNVYTIMKNYNMHI